MANNPAQTAPTDGYAGDAAGPGRDPPGDLCELLQAIVDQVDQLIACDACAVLLLEDDLVRPIVSPGLGRTSPGLDAAALDLPAEGLLRLVNDGQAAD